MKYPQVGVSLNASKEPALGYLTAGLAPGDSYGTQGLLYIWGQTSTHSFHRINEVHH
jgi:hypothetical protein